MSNSGSLKEKAIPSTSTTMQLSSNQVDRMKKSIPKFNISFPYAAQPDISKKKFFNFEETFFLLRLLLISFNYLKSSSKSKRCLLSTNFRRTND